MKNNKLELTEAQKKLIQTYLTYKNTENFFGIYGIDVNEKNSNHISETSYNKYYKGKGYYLVSIKENVIQILYPKINNRTISSLLDKKGFKYENNRITITENISIPKKERLKYLENMKSENSFMNIKERLLVNKEYAYLIGDSEYTMEELEIQKKRRIAENKIKEEESREKALSLSKLSTLPINDDFYKRTSILNTIVTSRYNRQNVIAYRGVMRENIGTGINSGGVTYGFGLYTTTNKSYAEKFGEVSKMDYTDLPYNPLQIKAHTDFQIFEQEMAKYLGINVEHMHLLGSWDIIISKLGFDGMTIGVKKDMILVKYF